MFVSDPTYLPDDPQIPMEEYLHLLSTLYMADAVQARISWEEQWCPAGVNVLPLNVDC